MHNRTLMIVALGSLLILSGLAGAAEPDPCFVPWPKSLQMAGGALALTSSARILAASDDLVPLTTILADELFAQTGLRLATGKGAGGAGDIVLRLDPALEGEAYELIVQDRATVAGGGYASVAMGTVTLLQAMTFEKGVAALPRLTVKDQPRYGYRGLMIDVARSPHSIDSLRQVVELCRLYKVRYLHLHLTDNEAFTFPSTAFPALGSRNRTYKLDELKALVTFADRRGVTIVPELEAPGHCGAMQGAMPDTFGLIGPDGKPVRINCLNFMNPKAYPALDTLVGEICQVFQSSPYVHIGSDEAWLGQIGPRPETARYLKENNLENVHELYMQYIVKMNEIVKKHGRRTIVWEGFGGTGSRNFKIPTDVIVMEFEVRYNRPADLIRNGYTVINASWTPMYVVNGKQHAPENILGWDVYRFGQVSRAWDKTHWAKVEPTPLVAGAQMCAWEQPEWREIPSLRRRVAAMAQQVWNPGAPGGYGAFAGRLAACDALLDKLLYGFTLDVAPGPTSKGECAYVYKKAASVSATPLAPGLTVRYTMNAQDPTADSPLWERPLEITEKDGVNHDQSNSPRSLRTVVRAAAFRGRQPAGAPRVLFLDNYDYLARLPGMVRLKVYENPAGGIERPDLSKLKLVREAVEPHVWPNAVQDLPARSVLVYEGRIDVPAEGSFECRLRSHGGGARLYVNDQLVCDRSGKSDWGATEGSVTLSKGPAGFRVECYQADAGMYFSLAIGGPSLKKPVEWNRLLIPVDRK